MQAALPSLKRTRGSVVNVSSIAAVMPAGRMMEYGAAKAAQVPCACLVYMPYTCRAFQQY